MCYVSLPNNKSIVNSQHTDSYFNNSGNKDISKSKWLKSRNKLSLNNTHNASDASLSTA